MEPPKTPIETFAPLSALSGLRHGFVLRTPGVAVDCDKNEALRRLEPHHEAAAQQLLGAGWTIVTGEQVHGDGVLCVDESLSENPVTGVDGFVTNLPQTALGIHVADCGAVFLADPVHRAVGLVHSGKKGSELGIAVRALELMAEKFGTRPTDVTAVLAACVRPPAYEIDFAAQIRRDCLAAGIPDVQFHDAGECTSKDLTKHYSYRIEKGKTGRMLALIGYD